MGDGYTKLFSDIVDSSIWDESAETCKVWVTLLALSNADGLVRGSVGWLAGKSRVTVKACELALKKFAAPDPKSRTPDNDGRRIEVLEDGWLILNYLLFRDRLSMNPIAVKTRERVRKHRERYTALRNGNSVTAPHPASASASASESVPVSGGCKGGSKFVKPTQPQLAIYAKEIDLPVPEIEKFYDYYESNGWKVGKAPMKSWQASMRNWKRNVKTYGSKTRQPNSLPLPKRNIGVIDNNTDYAAAGKAKLARQASQVAQPMAPTPGVPPHGK
jgi:hypothetical protein